MGRAELGAEDYRRTCASTATTAVGIGIFQLPGANALALEARCAAELQSCRPSFPPAMQYKIAFDPTVAVSESIREVLVTLVEAIVLVILVIFVFLQSLRATLIPAVTIPVSLVGTFAFVKLFGFSINTLTLFGITLATGLVVDDAIVVIENISRIMSEKRGSPHAARRSAMSEVAGAVIATSLVLIAVFVPVAFFPGTTGRIYQQFSLTIAFSVAISTFNALTLSPALAALLLRRRAKASRGSFCFSLVRPRHGVDVQALSPRGALAARRSLLVALVASVCARSDASWSTGRCRAASCPTRIRATSWSTGAGPEGSSLDYTTGIASRSRPSCARAMRCRTCSRSPASASAAAARIAR